MSVIKKTDKLIEVATGQFNLTLNAVSERLYKAAIEAGIGGAPTFGDEADEAYVESLGYAKVYPTDRPMGDWFEVTPVKGEDGKYHRAWEEVQVPVIDPEVLYEQERQELVAKVKAVTAATQEVGCPIDFGDEYGVLHIQMRVQDPTHLTVLRIEADEAVREGRPEELMVIRTTENINVQLMAQDVVDITRIYSTQYKTVMGWNWNLIDALRAAVYPEPFIEVPNELVLEISSFEKGPNTEEA